MISNRTASRLALASFCAGGVTALLLTYEHQQRTLKFIGIAYKLAQEEIAELKGEADK